MKCYSWQQKITYKQSKIILLSQYELQKHFKNQELEKYQFLYT